VAKKAKRAKGARNKALVDELSSQQQQLAVALESLTAEVRAMARAHATRLEEIGKLLDDVLVAQHRTNHLLELALRAGFDDDEHARAT
jgi:hypothetical protein